MPQDRSQERSLAVEAHPYTPDSETEVLAILRGAFGPEWGDQALWRWKYLQRPGFSVHDVRVYRSGGKAIGCWHMAARTLRLGPGLGIAASIEGDYAMHPDWRGIGMGRDPASLKEVRALAERGIVARLGFTSQVLYERLYRPKLGYRRIGTATAEYRKLLSDKAIRERLQRAGEELRSRAFIRRLVRERPLTMEIEVSGFRHCLLIVNAEGARCTSPGETEPDLIARVPYALISASTTLGAAGAAFRALLRGKLRLRQLPRFARRIMSAR